MLEIVEREALGLSDASPAFSAAKLPRDLPAVRTARGLRVPSVRRRACDRVGRALLRAAVNIGSGLADKAACAGRAAQPRVGLPVIAAPWIRGPGPRKADQPTRDAPSEAASPSPPELWENCKAVPRGLVATQGRCSHQRTPGC